MLPTVAEPTSQAVTDGIRVRVQSYFLPEQSSPRDDRYVFAYTITIANQSDKVVQLLSRHWVITDASGHVDEVRGLAVVGHQPVLKPGEQFEYTSWTRIATPHGRMHGTFFCMTEDAHPFEAPIAEFGLTLASALH